ncbi:MAG: flagellar biosynthetic protein FliO [Alphaproteobacteria bacterium]|nr:flagellar biosynthetic protein FliO [Alphaproteobacteria bacterium]
MSLFSFEYLTTLLVLAFVIGLMLLMAYGVRRTGLAGPAVQQSGERRLSVVEILPIDARRRLVLVRRDDTEHLLLLGMEGERVVETGIDAADRPPPAQTKANFADTMAQLTGGRFGRSGKAGVPDRKTAGRDIHQPAATPPSSEPNDRP